MFLLCCMALWASALSAQPHWTCDYRQYQNDMTVYFMLKNGDAVITAALDNYEVAAFVGGECRGVATFETQTGTNGVELTYGFLKVYSNSVGNETVTLKYYDKAAAKERSVRDVSLPFVSNANVGYPSAPVDFPLEFDVTVASSNTVMGTVSDGGNYKSSTLVTATATPNTGYKFVSWSDGVTGNPYTFKLVSDTLLTAQFALQQFKVTFIADGVTVSSEALDYGATITPPAAPENGYTFVGWLPKPTTVPAEDVTFTAQYERSERVATFVVDGVVTSKVTVKFEDPLNKPADPVKTGYTFMGWTPEVPATMPNQDVTYTAQFAINSHQLTWKIDTTEVTSMVEYATKLTVPESPLKEGYTFVGWTPEVIDSMPDHNLVYTAQFAINRYRLSFIVDSVAVVSDSLEYAAAIVPPLTPVKEGYAFLGWFPTVDENMPARDVVYTAQFAINQYTVTFVFGNGEANVVKTQDYASALSAPADPVWRGFTFKGWSTAVPATVPAADTTFTAQWERNKYKLTWVVDGQKSESDVEYEGAITKPVDPVKEGYTFTGWDQEIAATMPDSALTYTAQFSINYYYVIYMVGDKEWARDSVAYGSPIVKKNYTPGVGEVFVGWTSDAEYTTMPAHNVTYMASITTAISAINGNSGHVDVYTIDGSLFKHSVPVTELRRVLRKGLYIINGKKLQVK